MRLIRWIGRCVMAFALVVVGMVAAAFGGIVIFCGLRASDVRVAVFGAVIFLIALLALSTAARWKIER